MSSHNCGYRGVYVDRHLADGTPVWEADICVNGVRLRKRFTDKAKARSWYNAQKGAKSAEYVEKRNGFDWDSLMMPPPDALW